MSDDIFTFESFINFVNFKKYFKTPLLTYLLTSEIFLDFVI